ARPSLFPYTTLFRSGRVHVHQHLEQVPLATAGHHRRPGADRADRVAVDAGRSDDPVAHGDGRDSDGDGRNHDRARARPTTAQGRPGGRCREGMTDTMQHEGRRPKVLLVGWDGVRDDTARRLTLPALTALAE